MKLLGVDVLLINPNGIDLEGYNCGFIGGSAFVYGKTVFFFGNISTHPDYEKIKCFLYDNNFFIEKIMDGDVCDFGGVKLFSSEKFNT